MKPLIDQTRFNTLLKCSLLENQNLSRRAEEIGLVFVDQAMKCPVCDHQDTSHTSSKNCSEVHHRKFFSVAVSSCAMRNSGYSPLDGLRFTSIFKDGLYICGTEYEHHIVEKIYAQERILSWPCRRSMICAQTGTDSQ